MTQMLDHYIRTQMRMSHVYQPVMLRTLLECGGLATVEDISQALLTMDRSQVEYYTLRTKQMVGKVLTKNGIVEPVKAGGRITGYRLVEPIDRPSDRQALIAVCDEKIGAFLNARGEDAIWSHRSNSDGYVPGSVRYEVLKNAHYRCELCGVSADDRALHVDHIIPRNKGGANDLSNYQALCVTCNTNKRDRDDTDFRQMAKSYSARQSGCLFCEIPNERIIAESELIYAIRDAYPVTSLHTLIIPKRHVSDYFGLFQPELTEKHRMIEALRADIINEDPFVTGFNIGMNAGASAGQTVFHSHTHLIPRRDGDVEDPRGGVRGVIAGQQSY